MHDNDQYLDTPDTLDSRDSTSSRISARPGSRALAAVRRIVAIAALCAVVATATATWLAGVPAEAAPGKRTSARVQRSSNAAADKERARSDRDADRDDDEGGERPAVKKNGKTLVGKLNINTATEDQLRMLPGIGPAKAQRILAYRDKRKFARVNDLRRVKGIGYKTLKKLAPYLTVRGETTLELE